MPPVDSLPSSVLFIQFSLTDQSPAPFSSFSTLNIFLHKEKSNHETQLSITSSSTDLLLDLSIIESRVEFLLFPEFCGLGKINQEGWSIVTPNLALFSQL